MGKQPTFQISVDAKMLAEKLTSVQVGVVVTYSDLSKIIGRPVQKGGRAAMIEARKIVQRDKRMVFDSVRNLGLKRLNDVEIVDSTSDRELRCMHRRTKRAVAKLVCVDYNALPNEKKVKHNATISMMGALAELTTIGSLKRVETKVQESGLTLPSAKTAFEALGVEG